MKRMKNIKVVVGSNKERKCQTVCITSMASTKYSDRIDIQAVIIESQKTDSHLEISGVSSSSLSFSPF
jgi:precorrin-3B methylase